ncbi:MAG: type II toxin-antitoxin system HigB family toxin [Mariprofundaceae bacterium]|nr:type II toxin-antitoxin system HigB family toxin [Mariprofundaceae bacterium]
MRVIARSAIREFLNSNSSYADSKEALEAWYQHTLKADWSTPAELKEQFKSASILQDGRVVFNIVGNKYRLVVWINYAYRVVYIRFIGTHEEYDKIDAQAI